MGENNTNIEITEKTEKKTKKSFCANPFVKAFSFVGIIAFCAALIGCVVFAYDTAECGFYTADGPDRVIKNNFQYTAYQNASQVIEYLERDENDYADDFLSERNIAAMEISSPNSNLCYTYIREPYTKNELPDKYVFKGRIGMEEWKVYLIPELNEADDNYYLNYTINDLQYRFRYFFLGGILLSAVLLVICFVVFVLGIGKSYKTGEVEENVFTKIPFDAVTILYLFAAGALLLILTQVYNEDEQIISFVILMVISVIWGINFIHRIKLKTVFKNSLCYKFIKLIILFFTKISLLWKTMIVMALISVTETLAVIFISVLYRDASIFLLATFLLFVEKCFIYPIVLYIVLMKKQLFKAGEKLAQGDVDYKINLTALIGDYKKHGENLNNLSKAVNNAVEERMKSERMKTELITNVSHDLKTPLTSVINYSDLINREIESIESNQTDYEHIEKISEYSEVLNRQSYKLKHLLEDLVEVSKASSGNMELHIERLDAGTILSQALGEYEERFEEKNLETILNDCEEGLYVKADSRKLWRVTDNLLQNIYKYALPGTRVFLEAKEIDGKISLTFKNTSRDIITVSAEELTERFTRNDDSRHTEGNGLGLAIAKTLTEAMGGKFTLNTDGDLFKVTVIFDKDTETEKEADTYTETSENSDSV